MISTAQLLQALRRMGVAHPRALARDLGVSQPTLSRALMAAGDRVCRMGRTRATRYASTRTISGLGDRLPVHHVDEEGGCRFHGTLTLLHDGRHWLETPNGGALFEGLPPFAVEMSPQGYLGHGFSAAHPELDLPPRLVDWTDDHRLIALAMRGEDCPGAFILGQESVDRHLASTLVSVVRTDYPALALSAASGTRGSSAGGEQPKFLAYSGGRHVLVKFAPGDEGLASARWRDLLVCEHLALESVRAAGLDAASSHWFSEQGFVFLEVERFDRIGARGRRGLLSMGVVDDEYVGVGGSWIQMAVGLARAGLIEEGDLRRIRWLEAFGNLIGNTDRHRGNLSLFEADGPRFRLAPVYDTLPMLFAPAQTMVPRRELEPRPPTAETLEVWSDAAEHAERYWARLDGCEALSSEMRELASECGERVAALRARVPL